MVRAMLLAAVAAFGPAAPAAVPVTASPPPSRVVAPGPARGWGWPLEPRPAVVRPFRAPPTPWSAGHRGVDLAAGQGQPVLAVADGRVTFAGEVAGRGVVVVAHAGGLRTTYEPVEQRAAIGLAVVAGEQVGVVGSEPRHCGPHRCLHWGLRRGSQYLDPLGLVGRGPPVLLPLG